MKFQLRFDFNHAWANTVDSLAGIAYLSLYFANV
jgi:hypothetical protein